MGQGRVQFHFPQHGENTEQDLRQHRQQNNKRRALAQQKSANTGYVMVF